MSVNHRTSLVHSGVFERHVSGSGASLRPSENLSKVMTVGRKESRGCCR